MAMEMFSWQIILLAALYELSFGTPVVDDPGLSLPDVSVKIPFKSEGDMKDNDKGIKADMEIIKADMGVVKTKLEYEKLLTQKITRQVSDITRRLGSFSKSAERLQYFETILKKREKLIGPLNLALGKPTKSSTCWNKGIDNAPSSAVDGSPGTLWRNGVCFATDRGDSNPWWQVDLGTVIVISEVHVSARSDCCPERLHDITVETYNQEDTEVGQGQICAQYMNQTPKPGENVILKCENKTSGRFLRIYSRGRKGDDLLQFCEVQVFSPEVKFD